MIEWVEAAGHPWGAQKRRILLGGFHLDGKFHCDGFNRSSVLARIRDLQDGAAGRTERCVQHFAEVYTDEGLEFQRALTGAREHWRLLADLRYAVPKQILASKQKLAYLQQQFPQQFSGRQRYYEQLDLFHHWLAGRWPRNAHSTTGDSGRDPTLK